MDAEGERPVLGGWVELLDEPCHGGRNAVAVNRRDRAALRLDAGQVETYRRIASGTPLAVADRRFVTELADAGFLTTGPVPVAVILRGWDRVRSVFATLDLRIEAGGRLLTVFHRRGGRWLFTRSAVSMQALLAVAGVIAISRLLVSGRRFEFHAEPGQVPLALGLGLLAVAVHEGAHALVAIHYGRGVDAVGLRLHLGTPTFYVESIDALLLPRPQRIVQAFAGSWTEFMVTSLMALWVVAEPSPWNLGLFYRFLVLNCITIATNLLPFVNLDGQLILADLVHEPRLGDQAQGAVARLIRRRLSFQEVTGRDCALAAYSTLNSTVAIALVATAGLYWSALFGSTISGLAAAGFSGWPVLLIGAAVLLRPTLPPAAARIGAGWASISELASRARFRCQARWRLRAITLFAHTLPELQDETEGALAVLAGRLHRRPASKQGSLVGPAVTLTGRLRSYDVVLPVTAFATAGREAE